MLLSPQIETFCWLSTPPKGMLTDGWIVLAELLRLSCFLIVILVIELFSQQNQCNTFKLSWKVHLQYHLSMVYNFCVMDQIRNKLLHLTLKLFRLKSVFVWVVGPSLIVASTGFRTTERGWPQTAGLRLVVFLNLVSDLVLVLVQLHWFFLISC